MNEYNNTYHKTIKTKPVDVNISMYFDFNKGNIEEGLKFKVGNNVRKSKIKMFLQKFTFQIGLKKFLWSKKLKTMCRRYMLLLILAE